MVLAMLSLAVLISGCSLNAGSKPKTENVASSAPKPKAENVAKSTPKPAPQVPANEPVARVASQVGPSVVQVNVKITRNTPFGKQSQEGTGSGVIYRKDGYIITNAHVVQGADDVQVSFGDGSVEDGNVVGADKLTDIAVVRVDRKNLPAAKFSDAKDLVVGQLAVAIGSPEGFESTVTSGVVSGLSREFPPELTGGQSIPSLVDLIQTDAAISPGNSGGALAERSGEIIGINVAYLPPAQTGAVNIGFAIPSDTATSVANQLIETGKVRTPYLGVGLADLSTEEARRFHTEAGSGGAIVESVEQNSAAQKAGIQRGDIIVALHGERIDSSADLLGALRDYSPGDTTSITVVRGGDRKNLQIQFGERPE